MLSSKYFKVSEFACHDGTPYPVEWIDDRLQKHVNMLDRIRDAWGGPIFVRSGYRTDAWNIRVGGAKDSQHPQGRASDIYPEDLEDTDRLHALILGMYQNGELPELGGLGRYPVGMWVHVDTRDRPADNHLAEWTGSGIGSEQATV